MVIEGGRTDPWNWRNVSRGAVLSPRGSDADRLGNSSTPRLVDNTNRGEFSAEGIVSTESPAWCLPSSLLGNQSVRLICRWSREEMSSYLLSLSLYLSMCIQDRFVSYTWLSFPFFLCSSTVWLADIYRDKVSHFAQRRPYFAFLF